MRPILDLTRINTAYPFIGRAAQRQMCGSINFTIANLVSSSIRARLRGEAVDSLVDLSPLIQKYGNTLDQRNEDDEATRGLETEAKQREEQGFVPTVDFMRLAGQLKVIRDALAEDLDSHAQLLKNPMDPKGGTYKDPYHVAPTLEQSFQRQLSQQPKVNVAHATAQAEALDLDPADVIRVQQRQMETGLRFLRDNKAELMALLSELGAQRSDGTPYSTADADEVLLVIPAIHHARLYVNADKGLWYERDRAIGMMVRSHPDGLGNIKLLDASRLEIHKDFSKWMTSGNVRMDLDTAVQRGATWPTLMDLPKSASVLAAERARAAA